MKPQTYYAHTMPGVEKIAWLEIRERFPAAAFDDYLFMKDQNGIVVWADRVQFAELLRLRTTEDVFIQLVPRRKLSRDWGDLREISRLMEQSAILDEAVQSRLGRKRNLTYRVISRQSGAHQYRRKDVEEACLKGIERRARRGWTLVPDDADVEIWINVLGSTLLCGLRLSDQSMRHRPYKIENLPASLRPSVAAAMVWLTAPAGQDVFLDAMCGSGTILAERMLLAPYKEILGGDISAQSVAATRTNLSSLGGEFTVRQWDACQLPLDAGTVDKAATNLPFGKQISSPRALRGLYSCFFQELARVLKSGATATVLSSEFDLVKASVRQQPALQIVTGYSIAVLGQWGRLYILQKQ